MDADEDDDDLFRCAICETAEGDALNLSSSGSFLQTNATVRCGHQFCNACLDRELVRKREFPCPICKTAVKRVYLTSRSLDHVQCEKDTSWRRRIISVYNKTEKDFASLVEYNNYLEEVEDMIYAIVNEEPAAEEIKASIKEYEQRYKSEIDKRQSKRDDEKRNIQDRIDAEHRQTENNRKLAVEEDKNIAINKRKFKTETTEVLLGYREEVTAELIQAQMQGYRNELRRQQQGRQNQAVNFVSPRVREPATGLAKRETHVDRQLYLKRQRAGGGIPVGSIATQDRTWNETVQTLFARL